MFGCAQRNREIISARIKEQNRSTCDPIAFPATRIRSHDASGAYGSSYITTMPSRLVSLMLTIRFSGSDAARRPSNRSKSNCDGFGLAYENVLSRTQCVIRFAADKRGLGARALRKPSVRVRNVVKRKKWNRKHKQKRNTVCFECDSLFIYFFFHVRAISTDRQVLVTVARAQHQRTDIVSPMLYEHHVVVEITIRPVL